MPVRLNSTGGGSVTLDVPATAGTFTVNLPAANGDVVVTGGGSTVQFGAGSASAPSITFSGDTNTGIYSPAADTIAFTEGGVEAMRIDASGRLGVGTSTPTQRLEVAGSGMFKTGSDDFVHVFSDSGAIELCRAAGDAYVDLKSSASEDWDVRLQSVGTGGTFTISTNGFERARITSGGNFLIGTTTDIGARLRVNGNSYFDNLVYFPAAYNQTTGNPANAHIATDGNLFRSTSSRKYKRDIQDATFGLDDVLALRPVTYKGKSAADGETVFGGLIAEEVHEAGLTQFVQYAADGTPDALAYGNMVALCVKAIQELKAKNDALEARLAAVEAR